MGVLAGGAALGGGLAGLFGGSPASNVQLPNMFQMPNMGTAATDALGTTQGLSQYNLYSNVLPQVGGITGNLVNNPYASGYQSGANMAGGLGQQQALGQYNAGQGLVGAAGQVLNTAMDPQQALYGRTLQQLQDQTNVQNAMSGVATTPYGAGVADQALSNFNIDWQNNQLQRQLSGLSGAQSAIGAGEQLSAAAPGQYLQASASPYSTYNTIGQGQLGALNTLGQFGSMASQNPQQQVQDYLSYLGAGNQAGSVANQQAQVALNQANLSNQQNQQYGNMIGGGLAGLNNMGFGTPLGGSGWGSGWSNLFGGGGSGYGTIGGTGLSGFGGLY